MRYLYAPGELEGDQRRAIDSVWSMEVYNIESLVVIEDEPVLYYPNDGLKHGFVRVNSNSEKISRQYLSPPGTA